jgi:hypothetical protein
MFPRLALAAALIGIAGGAVPLPAAHAETVPVPVLRPKAPQKPATPTVTGSTEAKPAAAKGDTGKAPAAASAPPGNFPHGRVYVMRGLVNVFSRGMDRITVEMRRKGINAKVFNHSHWKLFADQIAVTYRSDRGIAPIVLMGHSLGADAALTMANYLGAKGVPVRLVVAFDAVSTVAPVSNSVAEVINFYKPEGYGQKVSGVPGFKGKIDNVDLTARKDIGHLNIDKIGALHDQAIAEVVAIMKKANPANGPSARK